MKTHYKNWMTAAAVGALVALAAGPVLAQQSPDTPALAVKGTIVPGACVITFPDGGKLDFGNLPITQFQGGFYYDGLVSKDVTLGVTCPSARFVRFAVKDQQAGTQISDQIARNMINMKLGSTPGQANEFGLGTTDVDGKPVALGVYAVRMNATGTIDGVRSFRMHSINDGQSWTEANYLRDGELFSLGSFATSSGGRLPIGAGTAVAGKEYLIPMSLAAVLNKGTELQIAQDVELNGRLAFTVYYD